MCINTWITRADNENKMFNFRTLYMSEKSTLPLKNWYNLTECYLLQPKIRR